MYLGAKDDAVIKTNPLAAAIGAEGTPFAILFEPFIIALFTPFVLSALYVVLKIAK